jgi:hypothetical protein
MMLLGIGVRDPSMRARVDSQSIDEHERFE